MSENSQPEMNFWEHLEVLRGCLIRIIVAACACAVVAFIFKTQLFDLILAPKDSNFISYRLFEKMGADISNFNTSLINTGLSRQLVIHMKVAFYAGLVLVSPYAISVLFGFIAPALYANEKKYAKKAIIWGYVMFVLGLAVGYFLVFPLTFRFLSSYQVSYEVANLISLDSYIDSLVLLCISMGVFFELPMLCLLLNKMGILSASMMRNARRYAVVVILIAAAVITPTTDIFTLLVVALPVYLLYEFSILLIASKKKTAPAAQD